MKRLIALLIVVFSILLFLFINTGKTDYLALGDSTALGINNTGKMEKGYTDLIAENLNKKDQLRTFTKDFAKTGYTTKDLLNSITLNQTINNKSIENEIRRADLITISVGTNDLLRNIKYNKQLLLDTDKTQAILNKSVYNMEHIVEIIENNNSHVDLLVVGYYAPHYKEAQYNELMTQYITQANTQLNDLCKVHQCKYVDIQTVFQNHSNYLPEDGEIHPTVEGYQAIADEIMKVRKNNKK